MILKKMPGLRQPRHFLYISDVKPLNEIARVARENKRLVLDFDETMVQYRLTLMFMGAGLIWLAFRLFVDSDTSFSDLDIWVMSVSLGMGWILFAINQKLLRDGLRFMEVGVQLSPESFRYIMGKIVKYYELGVIRAQDDIIVLSSGGAFSRQRITVVHMQNRVLINSITLPHEKQCPVPLFGQTNRDNETRIKEELEDFAIGDSHLCPELRHKNA